MTKRCDEGNRLIAIARRLTKERAPGEFMAWDVYNQHCLRCEQCGGQKPGAITQPLDMAGLKEQEQKE